VVTYYVVVVAIVLLVALLVFLSSLISFIVSQLISVFSIPAVHRLVIALVALATATAHDVQPLDVALHPEPSRLLILSLIVVASLRLFASFTNPHTAVVDADSVLTGSLIVVALPDTSISKTFCVCSGIVAFPAF